MSAVTIDEVLNKLKNVKRNGKGYSALCPVHTDKRNSLSINEGFDGKVLLKCHAGCSFRKIQNALGMGSNYNGNSHISTNSRRIVASYDYKDENGNLLYQAVRYEPKGFSQRRPIGNGGFIYNLESVRRVLYRLPEILKANSSKTIFICEGEKDADKLVKHNLEATTNSGGAGKWRDEYSEALQGRHIVILPDNDEPGMRHAKQVAHSLYTRATSIRIVKLPNLPPKGDVSDWLNSGNPVEELLKLVGQTPVYEGDFEFENSSVFLSLGEFMSISISNDVPIAFTLKRGEIGLLSAVTNRGKSTLIRNALLSLACGKEFLPMVESGKPRKVLLLDFETSLERLQPDLRSMTRNFTSEEMRLVAENFFVMCEGRINEDPISLSKYQHSLKVQQFARIKKIDLIVVDTLSAAFDLRNENDNAEVTRLALKPLRNLAQNVGASLIAVHHIGKSRSEGANQTEGAYKGRGASAFGAYATAVFNLYADKSDTSLITLDCAKRKDGGENFSRLFKLNLSLRWFQPVNSSQMQKILTNEELILEVFHTLNRPLKRGEIVKELAGKVAQTAVDRWLKDATDKQILVKAQHGFYSLNSFCQSAKTEQAEKTENLFANNS
jgi:putative DNA primase/helicase